MKQNLFYKPHVSIIMNCHNGEKYLNKSIKSVISQTYNNWELIFWNNKSSDNSKYVFDKFFDKRLKYFESKNLLKLYHARNCAISKAKGKYICFLDTDDWWEKKKLEEQVNFLNKNRNKKILYSNYYQYNQKTKKKKISFNFKLPSGYITQKLLNFYCIGILTVMIKKDIFKKFKFNSKLNIIGDFDFFIKLSNKFKISCIQKSLCNYRIHENNYSLIKYSEYNKELLSWLKSVKKNKNFKKYSFLKVYIILFKLFLKNFLFKFKSKRIF